VLRVASIQPANRSADTASTSKCMSEKPSHYTGSKAGEAARCVRLQVHCVVIPFIV